MEKVNVEGSLPSKEYLMVEYPGNVKNDERAISTLGGIDKVMESYNKGSYLQLHLPHPDIHDDMIMPPIYGELKSCSNFLLSVKKNSKKKTFKCEMEGIIKKKIAFTGMADFQFISYCPTFPESNEPNEIPHEVPFLSYLDVIPQSFSKRDVPYEYDFKDNSYSKIVEKEVRPGVIERVMEKKKRSRDENKLKKQFVLVDTKNLPQGPLGKFDQTTETQTMLARLNALFENRPIWTLIAIQANVPASDRKNVVYILPHLAFYWKNGPWRGSWNKYGFDPRKDSSSKIYQIIDFRIAKKNKNKKDTKPKRKESIGDIGTIDLNVENKVNEKIEEYTFTNPFGNKIYQFIDINNDNVKEHLESTNSEFDKITGWISEYTLNNIRSILQKNYKTQRKNLSNVDTNANNANDNNANNTIENNANNIQDNIQEDSNIQEDNNMLIDKENDEASINDEDTEMSADDSEVFTVDDDDSFELETLLEDVEPYMLQDD